VTWPVVIGIGLLGGLGAIARFGLDGAVSAQLGTDFPYGTLVVNVSGAFGLGALAGAAVGQDVNRLAGTGLVGAFTTFSTWALESHRLAEAGRARLGAANFIISLLLGLGAAWAGRRFGAWL
jgi:fluoride exporter